MQAGSEQLYCDGKQNKAEDFPYNTYTNRTQKIFKKAKVFEAEVNQNKIKDNTNDDGNPFVCCPQ